MSLDDTGRALWEIKRPPLPMLVAGRATRMLAANTPEPFQEALEALLTALDTWWPRHQRSAEEIYLEEYVACVDAADASDSAAVTTALDAINVVFAALLRSKPRALPAGDHYDLGDDDFIALLRSATKAGRLPVAQLDARLKNLESHRKVPWPELVQRADRMAWGRGPAWGKLDKRVRDLAALADLGARASWMDVGAQKALRLELDGTKRMAVLDEEELEALRRVIPTIPAA